MAAKRPEPRQTVIDPRRRLWLQTAALLPIALCLPRGAAAAVADAQGPYYVNDRIADPSHPIGPRDRVVVPHGSQVSFSVGDDAYRIRGGSVVDLGSDDGTVVNALRVLTGALLGVFGHRRHPATITTSVATIGIRGTAVYIASRPESLYFCTCYGHTTVSAGGHSEDVTATHHNAHEITRSAQNPMVMQVAQVRDHTDEELRQLEGYVGRMPPW